MKSTRYEEDVNVFMPLIYVMHFTLFFISCSNEFSHLNSSKRDNNFEPVRRRMNWKRNSHSSPWALSPRLTARNENKDDPSWVLCGWCRVKHSSFFCYSIEAFRNLHRLRWIFAWGESEKSVTWYTKWSAVVGCCLHNDLEFLAKWASLWIFIVIWWNFKLSRKLFTSHVNSEIQFQLKLTALSASPLHSTARLFWKFLPSNVNPLRNILLPVCKRRFLPNNFHVFRVLCRRILLGRRSPLCAGDLI